MAPTSTPEEITARLVAECSAIRALLAQANREEVLTRHQVGVRVCKIKGDIDRYGSHAIDWMAAELGMTRATLYRYATVAENWSDADMKAQATKLSPQGEPLSWSHLVLLTRVVGRTSRRNVAAQCITAGWTVRELARHLDSWQPTGNPPDAASVDHRERESVRAALAEGLQTASRATARLTVFIEALDERLHEADGDEELVERVRASFEQLRETVDTTLGRLPRATVPSRARLRVATLRTAAPAPVEDDEEHEDSCDETPPPRKAKAER